MTRAILERLIANVGITDASIRPHHYLITLERWRDGGTREARFVLGAADGHTAAERSGADLLLAFGSATWPHLLARAMLLEQLYRATAILAGHPYHREG